MDHTPLIRQHGYQVSHYCLLGARVDIYKMYSTQKYICSHVIILILFTTGSFPLWIPLANFQQGRNILDLELEVGGRIVPIQVVVTLSTTRTFYTTEHHQGSLLTVYIIDSGNRALDESISKLALATTKTVGAKLGWHNCTWMF